MTTDRRQFLAASGAVAAVAAAPIATHAAGFAPTAIQAHARAYFVAFEKYEAATAHWEALEAISREQSAGLYAERESLSPRLFYAGGPETADQRKARDRVQEIKTQIEAETPGLADAEEAVETTGEALWEALRRVIDTEAATLADLGLKAAIIARERQISPDPELREPDAEALLRDVQNLCPAPRNLPQA